ncbi:cupin domain-containing protein [Jeongeupia naejangsanensis]|uniref:Cupin domain-containing protein n=1 Tax=Jeongeupia naejangsanensis TaxID=613195 RepID=A0ABS2BH64_9NEIS|nr:cupin domain-containing protein [Jeongeupia naejangsanensis]MBM3114800.1 cupin domain-containing protein [Jeongeupia naejangsanensis]
MKDKQLEVARGRNYAGAHVGALDDLDRYQFFLPVGKGSSFPGKLFLKEPLGMDSMEVSLNKLGAGQSLPFNHTHTAHEELYIFLRGNGQFLVDGTVIDVREGSVIRVAPEGVRTWRNRSQEDLYYIVIQAVAGSMQMTTIEDGKMCADKPDWLD